MQVARASTQRQRGSNEVSKSNFMMTLKRKASSMDTQSDFLDSKECREEENEALLSPEPNVKRKRRNKENTTNSVPDSQGAEPMEADSVQQNAESNEKVAGAEPHEHHTKLSETLIQPSATPIVDSPVNPHSLLGEKRSRRKRNKKNKSVHQSEGAELIEHNGKTSETLVQKSICTIGEPPLLPTITVDLAIPLVQGMPTEKRNKKNKSVLDNEGTEPIEHNGKPPEISVQKSTCFIAAPPLDPSIPLEQKLPKSEKNKEDKSVLESEGAGPIEHNGKLPEIPVQKSLCSIAAPPLDLTITADPTVPLVQEMTKRKTKKRNKKNKSLLEGEGAAPIEHNGKSPEIPVQKPLDPTITADPAIVLESEGAVPIEHTGKSHEIPVQKPLDPTITAGPAIVLESERAGPIEHNGMSPEIPLQKSICSLAALPLDPTITADPAIPLVQEMPKRKRKRNKKNKGVLEGEGAAPIEHNGRSPEIPIQKPLDPTITADPAIMLEIPVQKPLDPTITDPAIVLESEGAESIEHNGMSPEIPVKKSICSLAAPPLDSTITADPTIPLVQVMLQRKRKRNKKNKSVLEREGAAPIQHNGRSPEIPVQKPLDPTITADPTIVLESEGAESIEHKGMSPEIPVQKSICSLVAPALYPTITADSAIPVQQMPKRKRKRNKKNKSVLEQEVAAPIEHNGKSPKIPVLKSLDPTITADPAIVLENEGAESIERNGMPPEIALQKSICSQAAPPLDPTITADPTIPLIQQMPKRKRNKKNKSLLELVGSAPIEHNGKSPEIPVQESIVAPRLEPTITIDSATPLDSEQKMEKKKRKRKKKKKNAPGGSELDKHNTEQTVETMVQRSEGLDATVTKVPSELLSKGSSMICQSCLQSGHRFQNCPRLKSLSMDEEVCFFCGEIGHSLAKCSVSTAGGGRFAKCLLCYAHGHFSYNCPGGAGCCMSASEQNGGS